MEVDSVKPELRERLDILEAQRLVLTIELRSALLRLIARLAMRNTQIEKRLR